MRDLMIPHVHGVSGRVLLALALCVPPVAVQAGVKPEGEPPQVRVLSVTARESIPVMTGGHLRRDDPRPGPWLLVQVEVTAPKADFSCQAVLSGGGLPEPRRPCAVAGDQPDTREAFLEYSRHPSFVPGILIRGHPGFVGLKDGRSGNLIGVGYFGDDGEMQFLLMADGPQLNFRHASPVVLTLAFDVPAGRYRLDLGAASAQIELP